MTLRYAINQMVDAFGHGPDAFAAAMGMTPAQFHNMRYEIKNQGFDVPQLLAMQQMAGSVAFAEYVCSASGGVFVALPAAGDVDNDELFKRQLALAKEVGELAGLMERALENGSIDSAERQALYAEAGKLFRMAHELVGVAVLVYGE